MFITAGPIGTREEPGFPSVINCWILCQYGYIINKNKHIGTLTQGAPVFPGGSNKRGIYRNFVISYYHRFSRVQVHTCSKAGPKFRNMTLSNPCVATIVLSFEICTLSRGAFLLRLGWISYFNPANVLFQSGIPLFPSGMKRCKIIVDTG